MQGSNLNPGRTTTSQIPCRYKFQHVYRSKKTCVFLHQQPSASSSSGPPRGPAQGIAIHGQATNAMTNSYGAPSAPAANRRSRNFQRRSSADEADAPSMLTYDNSSLDHERKPSSPSARNAHVRDRAALPQKLSLLDRIKLSNQGNSSPRQFSEANHNNNGRTPQRPSSSGGPSRSSRASSNNTSVRPRPRTLLSRISPALRTM